MLPPALTRINAAPRADHPLIERQRAAIGDVTQALENVPKARDAAYEQAFSLPRTCSSSSIRPERWDRRSALRWRTPRKAW